MNYDSIILEMLARIQKLEEEVRELKRKPLGCNDNSEDVNTDDVSNDLKEIENSLIPQKTKVSMKDIREYIQQQKENAKENGNDSLCLTARDIHSDMKLKSSYPMVCNAMRQLMEEQDIVIHETPSGNSSTLEIKYILR